MFYINTFFIYSILGFIFENIMSFIGHSHFYSGILYGPWTFIYAFAIFALMFLDKKLKNLKLDKWLEIFLFYIGSTIIMTMIEFSGGMLIEKLFHRVYWDYTNLKFNFGHYIALEVSLGWGLFATIVNYLLRPLIDKFIKKIPKFVTIILMIFFILDVVVSLLN